MKKKILFLLWMLLQLILPACQPTMTYHEMSDARSVATDEKEIEQLDARIERFERDAERAQRFYSRRASCASEPKSVWLCYGDERYDSDKPPESLDDLVKFYRDDRHNCGCALRSALTQY